MNTLYLLLGGNVGDTVAIFVAACTLIEQRVGHISSYSAMYRSAPWGFEASQDFINQVLCVQTTLTPAQVLTQTRQMEVSLGRTAKSVGGHYSSRCIDIDLLYYNHQRINTPELTIPHPRMHLRRFTMLPLADIAPDFVHPLLGKKNAEILSVCPDESVVERISAAALRPTKE